MDLSSTTNAAAAPVALAAATAGSGGKPSGDTATAAAASGAGAGKTEKLYVAIRSRPLNARELAASSTEAWRIDETDHTIVPCNTKESGGSNQTFQFGMRCDARLQPCMHSPPSIPSSRRAYIRQSN